MFREMRRNKQELKEDEIIKILENATSGVLALQGDDDYPYALPISYVYHNSKLYFHSAKAGHKIDAIKKCNKASFCVINQDQIIPEEYTTYFKSAIVFGKIRVMENVDEIREAMKALSIKYYPEGTMESHEHTIQGSWDRLAVIELDIEHMSGKEAIELVRAKQQKND